MYKLLIVTLVAFAGCQHPPQEDLRPLVAVTGRYSLMADAKPAPQPAAQCSNCRGTGRVGDGTVSQVCPRCGGTGKATTTSKPCVSGTCTNR